MRVPLLVALLLAGCASPDPAPRGVEREETVDHVGPPPPRNATATPGVCVDRWPCVAWDLEANGTPRFAAALHLDLANVDRVTRLRSGFGHDYSMGTDESCRSLKHYFAFRHSVTDWANVTIASPVEGVLLHAEAEHSGAGAQVWLQPAGHAAFRVILFHVTLDDGLGPGASVAAGQRIGHHVGPQTANDVAVLVLTPDGPRFVSYGDVLTDDAFAPFAARNVTRADLAIERAWRDANPMACDGEAFVAGDTSRDWVDL